MTITRLEEARAKYAKKLKIFITIGSVIIGIGILFFLASLISEGFSAKLMEIILFIPIGIFPLAILAVIAILCTYKDARAYKKLYKAHFVRQSLERTFTDLHYSHEGSMPLNVIKDTGMMNTGDVYRSNDFTSGKYKDVAFSQADVTIQEKEEDSDGHTQYTTIFKGRWLVFEFPKPFTFRLQVVEKHFGAAKKPAKDRTVKRKIERIHTESITFDKKFNVYAEDGFEAYYILDPAFIDHVEQLETMHSGKLMLCFINNQLHIAIYDNKDIFEPPSPFKPIDEQAEFAKIHQDIKTITDFIDFLKLDRKLFQK